MWGFSQTNTIPGPNGATPAAKSPKIRGGIVPLFVRHITAYPDPDFKLFGRNIQMLSLVGILRNLNSDDKEAFFEVEDHSGRVRAVMLAESDSDLSRLRALKVNRYYEFFGTVRFQEGRKTVSMLKAIPVDNFNVITFHGLSVIATRLEAEHDFKRQLSSASSAGAALANALVGEEGGGTSNMSALQEEVQKIIATDYSDLGIARRGILIQFPSYQGHEVEQALEFLINGGHIYTTIDSEHFKAV